MQGTTVYKFVGEPPRKMPVGLPDQPVIRGRGLYVAGKDFAEGTVVAHTSPLGALASGGGQTRLAVGVIEGDYRTVLGQVTGRRFYVQHFLRARTLILDQSFEAMEWFLERMVAQGNLVIGSALEYLIDERRAWGMSKKRSSANQPTLGQLREALPDIIGPRYLSAANRSICRHVRAFEERAAAVALAGLVRHPVGAEHLAMMTAMIYLYDDREARTMASDVAWDAVSSMFTARVKTAIAIADR